MEQVTVRVDPPRTTARADVERVTVRIDPVRRTKPR
jgi:hypothetical protein